jgi:hypothetical protein
MDLKGIGYEGVNWIDLAQAKGQWRAFVNMVINFGFHKRLRSS